ADAHTQQRLARKRQLVAHFDRLAGERDEWIARNTGFYDDEQRYMRFLVPEGLRVLEVGCGTGQLLEALKPARGVGIDISAGMVGAARQRFPHLDFVVGDIEDPEVVAALAGPFDVIVLS